MKSCIIGTRSSELAKIQAMPIHDHLVQQGYSISWKLFTTSGDVWQLGPLNPSRGNDFFTKEIDQALIQGEIDVAVHSLKDLSVARPESLVFACIPPRFDPADWLIHTQPLDKIITIGTSSVRREKMLQAAWPNVEFTWIRGNISTRIEKLKIGHLRDQPLQGIVLAAAGIKRMNIDLKDLFVTPISYEDCLPAPGQGAIVAEIRRDDIGLRDDLSTLSHQTTYECVTGERKLLRELGGGCQMPLGALLEKRDQDTFYFRSMYAQESCIKKTLVTGKNLDEIINKTVQQLNI
ncbi:MAG: hydroxymethylbilane synthase [Holophagaceae bacterium]